MWKYQNTDELYHYGVLGMRWGHRKAQPISDLRSRYDKAKKDKKQANREYSKAFNKAYKYSNRHPISQWGGGHKNEANKRWADAYDKASKSNKADSNFKRIKQERNNSIRKNYDKIQKNTKLGERILFNNSTRKLAAKYMTDNNMSMTEAKKKANKKAIRNTAIILGAIGAYHIGKKYLNTHDIQMPNGNIILSKNHFNVS